ncbi:EB module domain-containing protein [Ditylenchus destructor]|uniref:EB module domain-containing protein n=1 Tax=Ditylenchus destructor TaxID=166010 RepID=A0AAD4QY96_9BILA|nr:EB module domain-containing protein [Ditylenchus destructor]
MFVNRLYCDLVESIIYPGQIGCDNDLQCTTAYGGTRCINRQCVCPPGSKAMEQTCISEHAWPGEPCNQAQTIPACAGNSFCSPEGKCLCLPPSVLSDKQCIPPDPRQAEISSANQGAYGGICKADTECPNDLMCLESRCECPPGKIYHNELGCVTANPSVDALGRLEDLSKENINMNQAPPTGIEQMFSTLAALKNTHIRPYAEQVPSFNQLNISVQAGELPYRHRMMAAEPLTPNGEEFFTPSLNASKFQQRKRREAMQAKRPHEPCRPGDICLNGTSCANGICSCPQGYTFQNYTCSRVHSTYKPVNAACTPMDRCSGGSTCRKSVCACTDGSVHLHGRCRQKPEGRCSYGQVCSGGSHCHLGTCQCPAGHRVNQNGEQCVIGVAQPGESCQSGEKCANGSVCRFGQCMCATTDQHVVGGRCRRMSSNEIQEKTPQTKRRHYKPRPSAEAIESRSRNAVNDNDNSHLTAKEDKGLAKPGASCAQGQDCTGGAVCTLEGLCGCPDDEVEIEGVCIGNNVEALQAIQRISKSAPGQLCTTDESCTGHSICQSHVCMCPEGWTLFHEECLSSPTHKVPQKSHAILFSPEAAIAEHMDDNSLGSDLSQTRSLVPGAMCQVSLECPYRTECLRGVCRCKPLETIVNGVCRKAIHPVRLGNRCDSQKGLDCVGESYCFYGICVCLYGLVNIGHECASSSVLAVVPAGGSCSLGQQCAGGSTCHNGLCQCIQSETVLDSSSKQCVPNPSTPPSSGPQFHSYSNMLNKSDGQPQSQNVSNQRTDSKERPPQAAEQPLDNAELLGLTLGSNKAAKLLHGLASLGESPDSTVSKFNQILTANQMSINVLDQQSLKALLTGQLMRLPGVGEKCESICGPSAKCVRSVCRCEDGLIENGQGGCTMQPFTASGVQSYTQTSQNGGSPEMGSSFGLGAGLPGSPCGPSSQCLRGSICINNLCVCRPGYRPIDGICQISKVELGESCFLNEQCKDNGYCVGGVCACRNGVAMGQHGGRVHRCPDRPVAGAGEDCTGDQVRKLFHRTAPAAPPLGGALGHPGFSGFPEAINPGNRRCSRRNRYQSTQLAETKRFMYHTPRTELRRVIYDLAKSRIFRISGSHIFR